jgi:pyruvate dehydrogenase E1 component alpha subunit
MTDPAPDLSTPHGRYEMMLTIRLLEERIDRFFSDGLVHGTAHLCLGQEACAVGALSAARPDDPVISSHRGHGHFLARGAAPAALLGEMLGKVTGPCMGRGGSQHLCAADLAFYGTNGITGGGIPTATGLALSQKLRATGRAVLCFFGDGATNQGTFHESLNMASLWKLPIVYFCENNLYAMSTPVSESMTVRTVVDRADAYRMEWASCDGMDAEAVRAATAHALDYARAGAGPVLLEARCYRFCGHSKSDQLVYRSREEEEAWRLRDPIVVGRAALLRAGASQDDVRRIEERARARIEEAVRVAMAAPEPARAQVLVSPYSPRGEEP